MQENQLKPNDIELEVTESVALTDYTNQSMHLQQLAEAGFFVLRLMIGTGYSSSRNCTTCLSITLKIDISLPPRLPYAGGATRGSGHCVKWLKLGLEIVEGVELSTTASFLQGLGVKRGFSYIADSFTVAEYSMLVCLSGQ